MFIRVVYKKVAFMFVRNCLPSHIYHTPLFLSGLNTGRRGVIFDRNAG